MKVFIYISGFLVMLFFFTSCFTSFFGYGVILWSDKNTEYTNGAIIDILSESKLNEAYVVHSKSSKQEIMIPTWQVEFFKSRDEAEAFAAEYIPFVDAYVYSQKEGIPPVREEMGTSDSIRIVYKFKENQIAKVLSRSPEKTTIGNMEDYWYKVLIRNDVPVGGGKIVTVGIKGYCFGYYLDEITASPGEDVVIPEEAPLETEDTLQNFFSGNWRPLAFQDMISARKIDLKKFNPAWGLFIDREKQRISILMDKTRYIADYREIVHVKDELYTFPDSTLKIEMLSANRISATYVTENRQVNFYFINIRKNLEDIIDEEKERRAGLYQSLYSRGTVLSSSAYGSIELAEDNRFYWQGLDKLVPLIIPRKVEGGGRISFPYFLDSDLEEKYDGVVTFHFDDYAPAAGINFLYQFVENGLKLYFVDNTLLEDNEVHREGSNQVIIFFTFEDT